MTLALHRAPRHVDLVILGFEDVTGDRIISPIRKTGRRARDMEPTSVDFPIHPDVRNVLMEARRRSLRVEMMLPYRVPQPGNALRGSHPAYRVAASQHGQEIFPENPLKKSRFAAYVFVLKGILERETRLELATSTLAKLPAMP